MQIGPTLLVLRAVCPSPLVASLDVNVFVQDFTYPERGTGQPVIIMFFEAASTNLEMETKITKWCV